jgi:hypothetical protein
VTTRSAPLALGRTKAAKTASRARSRSTREKRP